MLRNEDQAGESAAGAQAQEPAAEIRVTAKEFAEAVARIQARRDEMARRLEGTVTIGDAVQELGLDATPEDILAEVQAARQTESASDASVHTVKSGGRFHWPLALIPIAPLVILVALLGRSVHPAAQTAAPVQQIDVQPMPPASVQIGVRPTVLVQDKSSGVPVLKTLSEVGDGAPVRCEITQTAYGIDLDSFSDPVSAWTVIKHNGKLYLRGWMANMSAGAVHAGQVDLHNSEDGVASGLAPVEVTVGVTNLTCVPQNGADDMILAKSLSPDSHFREKW